MADKQPARGRALNDGMTNDTWQKRRREDLARLKAGLDQSPIARRVAGVGAFLAHQPEGKVQGVRHNAEGLWDSMNFVTRLLDPYDAEYSPKGEAAWAKVVNAGTQAVGYAKKAVTKPKTLPKDLGNALERHYKENYLLATPVAPTMQGELERAARIGRNRGELKVDTALLAEGGLGLKGLTRFGKIARLPDAAYLEAGVTQRQLAQLKKLDTGAGHHNLRQRWTKGWPQWIRDRPLVVVKPRGISKQDMAELHFGLDDDFYGRRLSKDRRGPAGLSGEKVGMKRYNSFDRLVFGTPYPLQVAETIGGASVALKPFTFGAPDDGQSTTPVSSVPYRNPR